jgi:hypothetical protein
MNIEIILNINHFIICHLLAMNVDRNIRKCH